MMYLLVLVHTGIYEYVPVCTKSSVLVHVVGIPDEESNPKCNITSYSKTKTSEQSVACYLAMRGFKQHRFTFFFFRQHRFGSVLNRCGKAKRVAKIDLGDFKGLKLYIQSKKQS